MFCRKYVFKPGNSFPDLIRLSIALSCKDKKYWYHSPYRCWENNYNRAYDLLQWRTKRIGNVDEGDTVTDYLPSEREENNYSTGGNYPSMEPTQNQYY